MGVVKNLIVRIGADVSGVVKGMKTAYNSTRQATSQIRSATADMKKSVKDSFSNSRMSVREYTERIATLKTSHNAAAQNVERLTEKLSQMESVYDSLKSATAGLDLSKPLSKQIDEAYSKWVKAGDAVSQLKAELKQFRASDYSKDDRADKISSMMRKLRYLREESRIAKDELDSLRQVAESIGTENISLASGPGLEKLLADIQKTQQELDVAKLKAGELEQKLQSMSVSQLVKNELKSIGSAAMAAVREGVAELGGKLKNLGISGVKGLATLPVKLLGIGKSASSSNTSLDKMARSIRNIGIVAVGMRVFRGIFGELQGIISNYISQNDALSASVANVKTQLGQAMAPAINMVMAAMQRLMPVIQTIASAINAIFTALFGKVKVTTSGIKSSAGAAKSAAESLDVLSFDQINKLSDNSDSSGGGFASSFDFGEPPEWVKSLTDWIEKMKEAFRAGDWEGLGKIFGDGINSLVDAINAVDIGTKIGTFVDNLFTTLHSALSTINFFNMGLKVGQMLTSGVAAVNWNTVGETIGMWITALPSIVVGFIQNTNWGLIAESVSTMLGSAMETVGNWFRSIDWFKIGDSIWQFIRGIDFGAIASGLFTLFGSALAASIGTITGFIGGVVEDIKNFFTERIQACGGNIAQGLLNGILDGLCNLGTWVYDHIVMPFLEAFMTLFGIHSPSTVMQGLGVYLITGLLNGLTETWQMIVSFFDTALANLTTQFTQGWANIQNATKLSWTGIATDVGTQLRNLQTSVAQEMSTLRTQLADAWTNMCSDAADSVTTISDSMKTGFETARSNTKDAFDQMRSSVQQIWKSMASYLTSGLSALLGQFRKSWATLQSTTEASWKTMTNSVISQAETMQKNVVSAMEALRQKMLSIWSHIRMDATNAVSAMSSTMVSGFSGMQSQIQSICGSIASSVSSMCSSIIAEVDAAMAAIDRLSAYDGVSSVVSGHGGSVSYVSGGDYTGGAGGTSMHLATGGITRGPTYALIGEAGKEAVLPLENNTSWMDTLAQRLVVAGGGSGTGASITIPIYLGSKKVSQYVIKDINHITQTTGVCPIKV